MANINFHVFPIFWMMANQKCGCYQSHDKDQGSMGKHPITKQGFHEATDDIEKITRWWTQYPNANIGVATGSISGFIVLDVDPRHDGDKSLLAYPELPITVQSNTGGGGQHYYFKYNKNIKNGNNIFGNGLDCKSDGGYIIAPPSLHRSGKHYEWITDQSPFEYEMAEAPEWMLRAISAKKDKDIEEKKDEIYIYGEGERDTALTSLAGKMRFVGASEEEMFNAIWSFNNTRCVPPLGIEQVKKIAKSISKHKKGKKEKKLAITVEIMEKDENLKNLFRYNLFTKDLEYANAPKFASIAKAGEVVNENDFIEIKYYLSKRHNFEPETRVIIEASMIMSQRNTHHPVCDFIKNLKWDGVKRVDTWLIDYCGADDNEYIRGVGRKVLTAAIARIFNPGCKFDFMMILEGKQGIGKSQLVEALGGNWYLDTEIMERTKDTVDKMRGAWIIEISELVGFNKKDVESLKSFISRRVDHERLSYRRDPMDFPRQCIFIGTHNPSGDNTYFYDDTGNRRFWPVHCEKTDYEEIRTVRSQLFAEAKVIYDSGEKLYLDKVEQTMMASQVQEERFSEDPWLFIVQDYLKGKHEVIGKDILIGALGISNERMNKGSLMKVGQIMKSLGWVRRRKNLGGREWYYEKSNNNVNWEE